MAEFRRRIEMKATGEMNARYIGLRTPLGVFGGSRTKSKTKDLLPCALADVAGRRIRLGLSVGDLPRDFNLARSFLRYTGWCARFRAGVEAVVPCVTNSTRLLGYFFLGKK